MNKLTVLLLFFLTLFFSPLWVRADFWDWVKEKNLSISKIIVYRKIYLKNIEDKYSRVISRWPTDKLEILREKIEPLKEKILESKKTSISRKERLLSLLLALETVVNNELVSRWEEIELVDTESARTVETNRQIPSFWWWWWWGTTQSNTTTDTTNTNITTTWWGWGWSTTTQSNTNISTTDTTTTNSNTSNVTQTTDQTNQVSQVSQTQSPPPLQTIVVNSWIDFLDMWQTTELTYVTFEWLKQTKYWITFGQTFKEWDVPAWSTLIAQDNLWKPIDIQVDKKTTHNDWSLGHAIISMKVDDSIDTWVAFYVTTQDTAKTKETLTDLIDTWLTVRIVLNLSWSTVYEAKLDPLNMDTPMYHWLDWHIVNEWWYKVAFVNSQNQEHPHLMARINLRKYSWSDNIRVDYTVENNWVYTPDVHTLTYDAELYINNTKIYEKLNLKHYHHARWRKIFYSQTDPDIHIMHNVPYLLATKFIPNYDQTTALKPEHAYDLYKDWLVTWTTPMELWAWVKEYMPWTWWRPDLWPLPNWAVMYLLTQEKSAKKATLGIWDMAWTWAMHFRDITTDMPTSIVDHPNDSSAWSEKEKWISYCYDNKFDCTTLWTHDTAHQPSLAYLPYLVTWDYYYLEELQFWNTFNLHHYKADYRQFEKWLLIPSQLRWIAWSLRTLWHIAKITPDLHPSKGYWNTIMDNNLTYFNETIVDNPDSNWLHIYPIMNQPYNDGKAIAPWQDDFFTWSVWYVSELWFTKATKILEWKSKFVFDRILNPDFCWNFATNYTLNVRDSKTSPFYNSIKEVYDSTFPDYLWIECNSQELVDLDANLEYRDNFVWPPLSDWWYHSVMQNALAVVTDLWTQEWIDAWNKYESRNLKPSFTKMPTYSIVPRIGITYSNSIQQTQVEQTPVEQTPVEQTPVEQTPVEQTPVEQTPVEQTPVSIDYPVPVLPDDAFVPCSGNPLSGWTLWSWAWAWEDYEYSTIKNVNSYNRYTRLEDLSWNNNYFYSYNDSYAMYALHDYKTMPYTWTNASWATYTAPYPVIWLDQYKFTDTYIKDVFRNALKINWNFAADKEFYIAVALMNSKVWWARDILTNGTWTYIKYGQWNEKTNNYSWIIWLTINWTSLWSYSKATPKFSYWMWPMLIEVMRDSDNIIHIYINWEDKTMFGWLFNDELFDLSILWWQNNWGSSYFDDTMFEVVMCKDWTTTQDQESTREYLRSKWWLY